MATEQKEFAFYSTEITATVDPAEADPAPATLVVLDQPAILGDAEFNEMSGDIGRGSVIQTLGGNVVQDFGVEISDGNIVFSDTNALSASVVATLKVIYETVDGVYYFTDGFSVWTVRFARPNGFVYRKNLFWAQHGTVIYSYSIDLIVISKAI